ncbi:MAG: hypothetical protein HQM16_02150 [Deltaproteobacteria bacterium]|nr:hypothetical protein [Deltaproteobacteria bacterium]
MDQNIRIILVAPKYSGNVGACARVAANFNCPDIYAVAPQCDIRDKQAELYGKGSSREFLLGIKTAQTLSEALKDCHCSIAITRKTGEWSPAEIPLLELPQWIANKNKTSAIKTALVFGREDNCLTWEELQLCTHFCQIPTSQCMPTMNLSHAVAVIVSTIYINWHSGPLTNQHRAAKSISDSPATLKDVDDLMEHFKEVMINAGMTKAGNPERVQGRIRRILQRTQLKNRDVNIWRGFLSKIQVALGTKSQKRRALAPHF